MLYDRYHDKMKRVAALLGKLYSHLPIIIIALVVMLLAASAMIATKGIIVLETDCKTEIVYGEKTGYHAVVLWGIPTYEYRAAGEGDDAWTREKPVFPGEYQVRAFGRTSWFTKNYTEARSFTVKPREIALMPASDHMTYGDRLPKVTADLAAGDRISCELKLESMTRHTRVWANTDTLSITDRWGNDRSACYVITSASSSFTIDPRPLRVTVRDTSKVYDGLKLTYDAYEISGGKLAEGDSLVAIFEDSLTHAGEIENTPRLRVYNEKSVDVTDLYDFTVRSGKLKVEKRSLVVHTGSSSKVYNGEPLECREFFISESTPVVAGHIVTARTATTLLDAGSVKNQLSFSIRDRGGDDCTNDYSVFIEAGTLTVAPRSVSIHTDSAELVYDGTDQSVPTAQVIGGVGDTVKAVNCPAIRDVGSIENRFSVRFFRGEKDITDNYTVTGYTYGTVTVVRRPITVQIDYAEKPYTGEHQSSDAFTVLSNPFGLANGHTMTLKTSGSVLFGRVPVHYVEDTAMIMDAKGHDVTDQYDVSILGGFLTVVPRPITVSTPDAEKMYDGKPLSDNTYSITSGSILVGHRFEVVVDASITDVGSVRNAVRKISITEADSGKDVSMYYDVTLDEGTLTVHGIPVTIRTFGDEWMYDGKPHAGRMEFEWNAEQFLPGHYPTQAITTPVTVTDAGVWKNAVYVKILDGNTDVTANYEITYEFGDLIIQKRPITVRFFDISWEYDGTPHGDARCRIVPDAEGSYPLVAGHELTVRSERMIRYTDAGNYANVQPTDVLDTATGKYVTNNYAITYEEGAATITKRPISLRLMGEKIYDGEPMDDWYLEAYGGTSLAAGHTASAMPERTPTDAGRTTTTIVGLSIVDAKGRDVAKNYNVTLGRGTFTVKPRPISIQTADAQKPYDGTPLTAQESFATNEFYALVQGHRIKLTVTGSATEVGQYPNTFVAASVRILTAGGKDVTTNYTVKSITEGTLTVQYPCSVTVTTGSATKDYDGLPLFCDEYAVEVTEGELPEGFVVYVNVTGNVTRPGSVPNTATVTVLDGEGKDVTALVPVTVHPGVLTVKNTPADQAVFGSVYAQRSGLVYLRMASFGGYTGQGWEAATPYGGTLDGGYSMNFLPSLVIERMGLASAYTLRFEDMGMGMLPYYNALGKGPVVGSDTQYTDIPMADYTATYYPVSNAEVLVTAYNSLPDSMKPYLLGGYADEEKAYREFVHGQYLRIDGATDAYMQQIIFEQGFDPSDAGVITAVAKYIRNAAVYDEHYDPALDEADNVAISFLRDHKRGVCVHYATAATLLYRALGIPARYVTGFAMDLTAGEWTEIASPGHAWVEVYVDGLGWIPVEVTGSPESSDPPAPPVISPDATELLLIPAFRHKVYDGSYLYSDGELVLTPELEALLAKGYTYKAETAGAQREIGVGESRVTEFTLYDARGNDVTASFRLVKGTGRLQVTAEAVRILLYPCSKTADGAPIVWGTGDFEVLGLPDGVTLTSFCLELPETGVGYLTLADINALAGEYLSYRLMKGGVDVTADYGVVFVMPDGMEEIPVLTVLPRSIELTAASESRVDDGTPLSNSTVYLSKGSLMEGHVLEAYAVGEQNGVGSSDNLVDMSTLVIRDAHGNDVTRYYYIKTVMGRLTVVEKT